MVMKHKQKTGLRPIPEQSAQYPHDKFAFDGSNPQNDANKQGFRFRAVTIQRITG